VTGLKRTQRETGWLSICRYELTGGKSCAGISVHRDQAGRASCHAKGAYCLGNGMARYTFQLRHQIKCLHCTPEHVDAICHVPLSPGMEANAGRS
jgi:hypothetical protein